MTTMKEVITSDSPQDVVERIDKTVKVYVRPSDGYRHFLAVAYDLNIASMGDTPKEAFDNLCSDVWDVIEAAHEHGGDEAVKSFLLRGPNAASKADYRRFRFTVAFCRAFFGPALLVLHLARYVAKSAVDSLERRVEAKRDDTREYSLPAYKFCCA